MGREDGERLARVEAQRFTVFAECTRWGWLITRICNVPATALLVDILDEEKVPHPGLKVVSLGQ